MTDKRQKYAKVKCKGIESLTKQSIFAEYSLLQKSGCDYRIYYVNIDLRDRYGISVAESQTFLLAKRPSEAMNEEKRLAFAG